MTNWDQSAQEILDEINVEENEDKDEDESASAENYKACSMQTGLQYSPVKKAKDPPQIATETFLTQ
jgi:hypothetical protein